MTDQEKLVKVVKGLECHKNGFCFACPYNDGEDSADKCLAALFDENIALLIAQEPKVMTWEELHHHDGEPVYLEEKNETGHGWVILRRVYNVCNESNDDDYAEFGSYLSDGDESLYTLNLLSYGKKWRCWTSRPTDAQREATSWT